MIDNATKNKIHVDWLLLYFLRFNFVKRMLIFGVHCLFFSGKKSICGNYGSNDSMGDDRFGPSVNEWNKQDPRFDLLN